MHLNHLFIYVYPLFFFFPSFYSIPPIPIPTPIPIPIPIVYPYCIPLLNTPIAYPHRIPLSANSCFSKHPFRICTLLYTRHSDGDYFLPCYIFELFLTGSGNCSTFA